MFLTMGKVDRAYWRRETGPDRKGALMSPLSMKDFVAEHGQVNLEET
jgi:hypothetical protein